MFSQTPERPQKKRRRRPRKKIIIMADCRAPVGSPVKQAFRRACSCAPYRGSRVSCSVPFSCPRVLHVAPGFLKITLEGGLSACPLSLLLCLLLLLCLFIYCSRCTTCFWFMLGVCLVCLFGLAYHFACLLACLLACAVQSMFTRANPSRRSSSPSSLRRTSPSTGTVWG